MQAVKQSLLTAGLLADTVDAFEVASGRGRHSGCVCIPPTLSRCDWGGLALCRPLDRCVPPPVVGVLISFRPQAPRCSRCQPAPTVHGRYPEADDGQRCKHGCGCGCGCGCWRWAHHLGVCRAWRGCPCGRRRGGDLSNGPAGGLGALTTPAAVAVRICSPPCLPASSPSRLPVPPPRLPASLLPLPNLSLVLSFASIQPSVPCLSHCLPFFLPSSSSLSSSSLPALSYLFSNCLPPPSCPSLP